MTNPSDGSGRLFVLERGDRSPLEPRGPLREAIGLWRERTDGSSLPTIGTSSPCTPYRGPGPGHRSRRTGGSGLWPLPGRPPRIPWREGFDGTLERRVLSRDPHVLQTIDTMPPRTSHGDKPMNQPPNDPDPIADRPRRRISILTRIV